MDGARPSRFPHLSWLGYGFEAPAGIGPLAWSLNGKAHALHLVSCGRSDVRWISRGREVRYGVDTGSFHYLPADDASHTIVARPLGELRSFTLFLPQRHLSELAASDHVDSPVEFRRLLTHDDTVLQACMARLAARTPADDADAECARDEAARALVLRLIRLNGGGAPDWQEDDSTFRPQTLLRLVTHIDSQLTNCPSAADMALLVGLSPSHFAKKFRQTTGLSLARFVNRRRLHAAMDLLKDPSQSLGDVSLALGFRSQSHFTRLFSSLTSMTPAKYQRQFRRTVG